MFTLTLPWTDFYEIYIIEKRIIDNTRNIIPDTVIISWKIVDFRNYNCYVYLHIIVHSLFDPTINEFGWKQIVCLGQRSQNG